jgi:dTDP-glucose 4,6-dehydratase
MNTIFVSGGCGFIGSNFLNYMIPKYPKNKFVNIDALYKCSSKDNVTVSHLPNYEFVECNINNVDMMKYLFIRFRPDIIFHFAAQTHVDDSFEDPIGYLEDNIKGTTCLLETIRRIPGLKTTFFHISTDEVYGESDDIAKDENSLLLPTNPYAATKVGAEMMLYSYGKSFRQEYYVCRCNNVYGPNQYLEKLIPKFISYLKSGKSCPIQGKGDAIRSFIHAFDVARAIETIWLKGEKGVVYNIGSDDEFSVMEISKKLVHLILGEKENVLNHIEYVEDRSYNDKRYLISYERLKSLGWKKEVVFEEGLAELVKS